MPFHKSTRIDHAELDRVAQGWGKVVARRVHEQVGPELELDADDIETLANEAARVVCSSAIADLLQRKAALLDAQQPCPACQHLCQVQRQPRTIDFRGGPVTYNEPVCHCPACRRDFFPSTPLTSPDQP